MLGVLYSFRRCPYAMRARLALAYCAAPESVELREVVLKNKPQALLDVSPKATVPVLHLTDGTVIEESIEIMHWALAHNPAVHDLYPASQHNEIDQLIEHNDGEFKWALDRYKYADRYDEPAQAYRQKGEVFLGQLDMRLAQQVYLVSDKPSLADLAVFPFVRQFAHVDKAWFESSDYQHVNAWLTQWLASPLFLGSMNKYTQWRCGVEPVYFP